MGDKVDDKANSIRDNHGIDDPSCPTPPRKGLEKTRADKDQKRHKKQEL